MSRPTKSASATADVDEVDATDIGLNLAVIWGTCSAPPEIRTLESGSRVASLAVRTPASATTTRRGRGAIAAGTATSVPVTVWDPPAWVETLDAGDAVVVVGSVRRRFFATRTGTRGAKAEVEAATIAKATDRQLEQASTRALAALAALA
jgi:single-stranded DNA-binding protein